MARPRTLSPKRYVDLHGVWWVRTAELDSDGAPVYRKLRLHPGRPPISDEKRHQPYGVTLEPMIAERARRLGRGNLSQGLAIAVRRATQDPDVDFLS